jgi:DNA-binding response OmpR family regulator
MRLPFKRGTPRQRKKVLIADVERHIVRLVEVNLWRAGYTVVTTTRPEEALEMARSERPDLVILDIDFTGPDWSDPGA